METNARQKLFRLKQVCNQPRPSAVDMTLPALAAGRRRLLSAGCSAANPPTAAAAAARRDRQTDEQTDGHSSVTQSVHARRTIREVTVTLRNVFQQTQPIHLRRQLLLSTACAMADICSELNRNATSGLWANRLSRSEYAYVYSTHVHIHRPGVAYKVPESETRQGFAPRSHWGISD